MKSKVSVGLLVVTFVLSALLSGCGGGGSSTELGVGLTIGADTLFSASRGRTRATLAAPLDDGATVTVYNFATGQVIKTGTLSSGKCTLDITPNLTVAVVITGAAGGKNYRLSTLIASTPIAAAEYVADPATTIAAEALAEHYYKDNVRLDQASIDTVMQEAVAYVEAHSETDYSLTGGTVIKGTDADFGKPDSIDATELATVIASVPATINNNLVLAKNAVTQIKESGAPLRLMVSDDQLDLQGIFTDDVISKYQALGDAIGKLIMPALSGELMLDGSREFITHLAVGNAYQVTDNFGTLELTDEGVGTAGQITLTFDATAETPSGTYTVIAKLEGSTSTWTVTQKFSGDSEQTYEVSFPDIQGDPGSNPTLTGSISLADSNFTTPITFEGTATAVGANSDSYTSMTFTGTLTTPQVTNSGTYQVNFASSKPAGAGTDQTIHDFPTQFSMTNGRTTITGTGVAITITGNLTATTQFISHTDHVVFDPNHVELSGSYSNSHTGLDFTGSIVANATWVADGDHERPSTASIRLQGSLVRSGHPTYSADITISKGATSATTTIDLRAGANTLQGSGSGTIDSNDNLTDATLTLTNQSGVQFILAKDSADVITGAMKAGGETVAGITKPGSLLRITYTDSTIDEILF